MNVRRFVIEAMLAARAGWDRIGYGHRIHVMRTSPRWSLLP